MGTRPADTLYSVQQSHTRYAADLLLLPSLLEYAALIILDAYCPIPMKCAGPTNDMQVCLRTAQTGPLCAMQGIYSTN